MQEGLITLLTTLMVLAGTVGAILLLGWAARRLTHAPKPAQGGTLLIPRESIALDARRRLHLVQVGARHVLLLTGGENDLTVGWLDPE